MADWFSVIVIAIVTTGASCLGELLKVNNSLQELVMGYNAIGDDGMSSVADGLRYNKTLTELNVPQCRLSVKGTVVYMYKTEFKIVWPLQFSCSCSIIIIIVVISRCSVFHYHTAGLLTIKCIVILITIYGK